MSQKAESFDTLIDEIEINGFAIIRNSISARQCDELSRLCMPVCNNSNVARRGGSVYGVRNLLTTVNGLRDVISRLPLMNAIKAVTSPLVRPVYGVFFDKTADANWPVPWHQDVTIRVREQCDVAGFESRPVKDGAVHVVPPAEMSQQMLALRIHLDDATADHGALRVVPGSHRLGRLSHEQLQEQVASRHAVNCDVCAGDAMLMRPLLLHASSPCVRPNHRRVIHVEFAAFDLPGGLEWLE